MTGPRRPGTARASRDSSGAKPGPPGSAGRMAGYPGRRLLLGGASCGFFLSGLAFAVVGPTLLSISSTFDISVARAGILLPAQSFGWIAAVFAGGLIQDVIGGRRVLLGGVGLMVAALLAFALVPMWILAVPAMICVGLGFGLAEVAINASVPDAYSERRGWALNLIHAFLGGGAVIAPLVVGLTARGDLNWRYLYAGISAFGVLPFLLITRATFPSQTRENRPPLKDALVYFVRQRRLLAVATILGLYLGAEAVTTGWGYTYLVRFRGQSEAHAGVALSLFWLGLLLGRILTTWVVEHIDYALLILAASFVGFVTLTVTVVFGQEALPTSAGFMATGFFLAPLFATSVALAQRYFPLSSGLVSGLVITVGGFCGPAER